MGLFLQQDNVNDFKSMCMDIWDRCLSSKVLVNMSTHDSVKILCQMLWHFEFCIALKRTKRLYNVFHSGTSCTIQASANRVPNLERWS